MLRSCIFLFLVFVALSASAVDHVEITVTGLEGEEYENVIKSLSLENEREHPRLSPGRIQTLHKKAPDEIRKALEVFGYYHVQVESKITHEGEQWHAIYNVVPGEMVTIATLEIEIQGEGGEDIAFKKWREDVPLQVGQRLRHDVYEATKKNLLRIAAERGYFEAGLVRHEIKVNPDKNEAGVWLHIDTGPRFLFGEVEYPETILNETVLAQLQPFTTGDPYSSDRLIRFQQQLTDSDYFEEVAVFPVLDKIKDRQVPVQVSMAPRKRNRYTFGPGFGTDTGPRLVAGYEARYLNDLGHRFATEARLSPVQSSLTGTYTIPFFGPRNANVGITTKFLHEDTDTSTSTSASFGLGHTALRGNWNETASISYLFEDFDVGDEITTSQLIIPGVRWWRSGADDPVYTRNGFRLSLDIKGAHESLLSDVSFIQTQISGKYIHGLGDRGRLITRGELGAMGVNDFDRIPASLRFFAGGDNSIRGFDFDSLGPRDHTGKVVGGKYLMVGSVEYEHLVHGNWGAALFSDFGNAINDFDDDLVYSVGAGIRWRSPVGLVRADIAAGISEDDLPIRFHLVLGPDL